MAGIGEKEEVLSLIAQIRSSFEKVKLQCSIFRTVVNIGMDLLKDGYLSRNNSGNSFKQVRQRVAVQHLNDMISIYEQFGMKWPCYSLAWDEYNQNIIGALFLGISLKFFSPDEEVFHKIRQVGCSHTFMMLLCILRGETEELPDSGLVQEIEKQVKDPKIDNSKITQKLPNMLKKIPGWDINIHDNQSQFVQKTCHNAIMEYTKEDSALKEYLKKEVRLEDVWERYSVSDVAKREDMQTIMKQLEAEEKEKEAEQPKKSTLLLRRVSKATKQTTPNIDFQAEALKRLICYENRANDWYTYSGEIDSAFSQYMDKIEEQERQAVARHNEMCGVFGVEMVVTLASCTVEEFDRSKQQLFISSIHNICAIEGWIKVPIKTFITGEVAQAGNTGGKKSIEFTLTVIGTEKSHSIELLDRLCDDRINKEWQVLVRGGDARGSERLAFAAGKPAHVIKKDLIGDLHDNRKYEYEACVQLEKFCHVYSILPYLEKNEQYSDRFPATNNKLKTYFCDRQAKFKDNYEKLWIYTGGLIDILFAEEYWVVGKDKKKKIMPAVVERWNTVREHQKSFFPPLNGSVDMPARYISFPEYETTTLDVWGLVSFINNDRRDTADQIFKSIKEPDARKVVFTKALTEAKKLESVFYFFERWGCFDVIRTDNNDAKQRRPNLVMELVAYLTGQSQDGNRIFDEDETI